MIPATKTFSGYALLSDQEKKIYDLMSQLTGSSVWHEISQAITGEGDAESFRSLLCQVKSEGSLAPLPMQRIIGVEAWALINQL